MVYSHLRVKEPFFGLCKFSFLIASAVVPYLVPSTLLLGVTFQKRGTVLCKFLYSHFETYRMISAIVILTKFGIRYLRSNGNFGHSLHAEDSMKTNFSFFF
jgi:hypothetical protein